LCGKVFRKKISDDVLSPLKNHSFKKNNSPLGAEGMKYTQSTLDKLEKIVEEAGYVIRYERGTFQSGYCILEQKKVVVLNKFLQTEGRINTLIDLIPQLDIQPQTISEESKKIYLEINSKLETKENK